MDFSQSTTHPRNELKNVTFEQEGQQNAIVKGELYLGLQDRFEKRLPFLWSHDQKHFTHLILFFFFFCKVVINIPTSGVSKA